METTEAEPLTLSQEVGAAFQTYRNAFAAYESRRKSSEAMIVEMKKLITHYQQWQIDRAERVAEIATFESDVVLESLLVAINDDETSIEAVDAMMPQLLGKLLTENNELKQRLACIKDFSLREMQ